VISANQVPDHATVARFRVRHQAALADLFGQVLALCADAGLVSVGVIALDGSKLAASASDRAIRTYDTTDPDAKRMACGATAPNPSTTPRWSQPSSRW
jgi:hypothetical protein